MGSVKLCLAPLALLASSLLWNPGDSPHLLALALDHQFTAKCNLDATSLSCRL